MNKAKKVMSLALWLVLAVMVYVGTARQADATTSQTILKPGEAKKSVYPKIVIYTVAWCPHCRELKEYLTTRNIPFVNRDVELEPAAMDELVNKYGTYGVPIVVIGDGQEMLKGFNAEQFEKAVDKVRTGNRQK